MKLKEIALTAVRPLGVQEAALESASRVVCSLLVKALSCQLQGSNFWKISIRVNHATQTDDGRVIHGVLIRYATAELGRFATLSREEKGQCILDIIIGCLTGLADELQLPPDALDYAREFVIEQRYVNEFRGKPGVRSPDKKLLAYVMAEQSLDAAEVVLRIETAGGVAFRTIPLATDSPDEFIFQRHFGKIIWRDARVVSLVRLDGTEFTFDLKAH